MIIGGAHWVLATMIAVAIHLVGMAWLGLEQPVRRIEPERASEGIVVTLGRHAGNAGKAAEPVTAEQRESVADADLITAAQAPAEDDPAPASPSDARKPTPDETAAEPVAVEENAEPAAAAAAVEPDAAGQARLPEAQTVEPESVAARQANEAASPEPEAPPADPAAEAASQEPEAVAAQPVPDAPPAVPQTVKAREMTDVEAVETEDARTIADADPGVRTGESVPVEFAEATIAPEAPDAPTKTPEAETLWSGTTPVTPDPTISGDAPAPTAEAPRSGLAGSLPPAAPAESVEGLPPPQPIDSTMQIEAVEPVPLEDNGLSVAAARPPAPEIKQVSEPETSDTAAPEVVNLQELQEREAGGSGVVARYAGVIKGWLQKNMHYPRAARLAGQEGDVVVRFIIDRDGSVQTIALESGSGYPLLDREAREMIERGDPFPAMPEEMPGARLEVRVPVSFHVRDETRMKEIPPIYLE